MMEEFKKPLCPNSGEKLEKDESLIKSKEVNSEDNNDLSDVRQVQTPYKIPEWSDKPSDEVNYSFEVLKSGQIIDKVQQLQKKAYWSFGRLPENDIEMAHPTISRFHAILQYRPNCNKTQIVHAHEEKNAVDIGGPPEGWYIFDLGSTHGTFLNKQRIPPKVYIRIRVGHLLRLGASSRSYILQGPTEDEEPESKLSITEIKAKRLEEALEKNRLADEAIERAKNESCTWGMTEDADEETDLDHNPYAITNNEELFFDDPKKTLRGYFEREDAELIYKCDEMSAGSFVCRIELPIDDANGRPVVAEVIHKGKKKDCVLQCALEACRILDRHGVLRQANQEPLKRKQKLQQSDSDDDEFWDRTGDVARKKQRKATSNITVILTYENLIKQETDIDENIKQIECKIKDYQDQQQRIKAQKAIGGEDLDSFMETLSETEIKFDKTEIRKLRIEEQRLKAEKQKLQRLIKIAKPHDIPFVRQPAKGASLQATREIMKSKQLPIIGKRNQFNKFKIAKVQVPKDIKPLKLLNSDEEEMEDDEMAEDKPQEESSRKEEMVLDNKPLNKIQNIAEKSKENETNGATCQEEKESFPNLLQSDSNIANSNKKRRQRIRYRGKREEMDMNDGVDYESCDKYAKWLPPENQTGDGFTELNKKFGY